MPPIDYSDDGSEDEIPSKESPEDEVAPEKEGTPAEPTKEDEPAVSGRGEGNDEEEVEDEDEDAGEEYVVEKIIEHAWDDKDVIRFLVKWKGYESNKDLTWEPIENLEGGAEGALKDYYNGIGGKPKKPAAVKRKRKSLGTPQATTNRRKSQKVEARDTPPEDENSRWKPPAGSWEEDIQAVDTIERDGDVLWVYLFWRKGKRTRHPLQKCYVKCPQTMLRFYEQHLVFKEGEGPGKLANGSD
ncbi:MAG: hypothetical protein M1833_000799 [Piccolia ochrophora]|nr:MAG: hypothetical protein M1833_000799 [Piccolia ochrophora]